MKLIVGLGNIGREYENTRHNIGFMVVDELARRLGVSFGKEDRSAYMAEYRAPEKIIIIKPTTYMNLSGVAVGAYANFYHIDPDDIAEMFMMTTHNMPLNYLIDQLKEDIGEVIFLGIQPDIVGFYYPMTQPIKDAVETVYQRLEGWEGNGGFAQLAVEEE